MSEVYFTFDDDVLFKSTPCPELGENVYKTEIVIDKEAFLECMKRWMTESEGKE